MITIGWWVTKSTMLSKRMLTTAPRLPLLHIPDLTCYPFTLLATAYPKPTLRNPHLTEATHLPYLQRFHMKRKQPIFHILSPSRAMETTHLPCFYILSKHSITPAFKWILKGKISSTWSTVYSFSKKSGLLRVHMIRELEMVWWWGSCWIVCWHGGDGRFIEKWRVWSVARRQQLIVWNSESVSRSVLS